MIIQHQVFINGQNTEGWKEAISELTAWVKGVYQSSGGRKFLQHNMVYKMMGKTEVKESYLDVLAELRAERARDDIYTGLFYCLPQHINGIPIIRRNPVPCIIIASVNMEKGNDGYEITDNNPSIILAIEEK